MTGYPPGVSGVPEDSARAVDRRLLLERMGDAIGRAQNALYRLRTCKADAQRQRVAEVLGRELRNLRSAVDALCTDHEVSRRAVVILEYLLDQVEDRMEDL